MASIHRKEVTLYEEAKAGLSSLVRQLVIVFIGFVVMLLLTGGAPSGFVVALSFCLGTAFVAWKEQKRISRLRSTEDKTAAGSKTMNILSVNHQSVRRSSKNSGTRPRTNWSTSSQSGHTNTQSSNYPDKKQLQILPTGEIVVTSIQVQNLLMPAPKESVVEVASELRRLLEQFSQAAPNNTVSERMVVFTKVIEEIERQPQFKQQLIKVMKSGGIEGLRESIEYPDVSVLLAALETYTNSSTQIDS